MTLNRIAIAVLVLLTVFKLWLVGGLEVHTSPWDPREYLRIADGWYWGNRDNYYRPPGFPLYIATARAFGIPLRMALELLFLLASWRAAMAMRSLGYPIWVAILVFSATAFCPNAIELLGAVTPETLVAALALLLAAETAVALAPGAHRARFLVVGLIAGIVLFTRPEMILLLVPLALALTVFAVAEARAGRWRDAAAGLGLAIPPMVAVTLLVASFNGIFFGRFSQYDDLNAPTFLTAYGLVQSAEGGEAIQRVPVSRAQMVVLSEISPAFAELMPYLDSDAVNGLLEASRLYGRVENNEFAGGWWIWAMRNAVSHAGHYSLAKQDAYYERLTHELRAARDRGELAIRWSPSGLIDPKFEVWLPALPAAIANVVRLALPSGVIGGDVEVTDDIRALFDRMATRRTALVEPGRAMASANVLRLIHPIWSMIYTAFIVVLAGASLAGLAIGFRRFSVPAVAVLLLTGSMVTGRLLLFALVDASSYPLIDQAHYLLPAAVLLPFMFALLAFLPLRTPTVGRTVGLFDGR